MRTRRTVVAVVTVCSLLLALRDVSAEEPRSPARIAEVEVSAGRVAWKPTGDHERLVLTIAGPKDLYIRQEFAVGQSPFLNLVGSDGSPLLDGMYTYELETHSGSSLRQTGYLSVKGGAFVTPQPRRITAEETIPEDLFVQGAACIGFDCEEEDPNGATLTLKDHDNLSIFFEDSAGASSNHDWLLQANDIFIGAGEYFSIVDGETFFNLLTLEADAPDNSLYVRSNGNVGMGTSTPSDRLHVLENVNANTLATVENWNTGASAAAFLRTKADVGTTQLSTHSSGRTITRFGQTLANHGEILHTGGNGLIIGTLESDDLILGTNNANRVQINGSTGAVTIAGNLTVNGTFSNPSSRELKESFVPIDSQTVLDKLARLPIQEWSYKSDDRKLRHVGPTVEDFKNTFGLGTEGQHIFPMDVQGVTMTAVQGLYQVVREKDAEIADLRQRLAALEELVSKLAAQQ